MELGSHFDLFWYFSEYFLPPHLGGKKYIMYSNNHLGEDQVLTSQKLARPSKIKTLNMA